MSTPQPRPAAVIILEDDPLVRSSLVSAVTASGDLALAGAAGTLAEARRLMATVPAKVGVFDLCLPDGSSLELISDASAMGMSIVVISVIDDESTVFRALAAGASGYLLKPAHGDDVRQAIRDLLGGGSPVSPQIARWLLEDFRRRSTPVTPPPEEALTAREWQVVELFSTGATYSEVARDLGISVNTVRQYVRALYDKLHVCNKTEAVTKMMPHLPR